MLVYMAVYVAMNVGTFAFILSMEKDGQPVTDIDALNLYSRQQPMRALAMLILLFSLAGVPPMLGFFAKFGVLRAAVDAGMAWLRIVYFMYFGTEREALDRRMPATQWLLLVASAVVMIAGVVNLFGVEGAAALAADALVD